MTFISKTIAALLIISTVTSVYAGFGRAGSSGGFRSGGFSRSYSAPNRSYTAPRTVYRPAQSYHTSSVEHHYTNSGGSGVGHFMMGALVGNALSQHGTNTVIVQPQAAVQAQPAVVSTPVDSQPAVYAQEPHGAFYYIAITLILLLGATIAYQLLRRL